MGCGDKTDVPVTMKFFSLILDIVHKSIKIIDRHEKRESVYMKKDTILIVDDEIMITEILAKIISRISYRTHVCRNGKEAMEYYREYADEIALVILDMIMPEMNGRDTFYEIRKIDPKAKVLLISGYASEEDAQDLIAQGAIEFIEKPFRSEELISAIEKILG